MADSRRSGWWGLGGVLVGFAAGGLAFRWPLFWDWVKRADWSSLPAVIIGTTVPAVAGVVFAQSLAKRSVRTLRQVELETQDQHNQLLAAAAESQREARRAAWERLFDACEFVRPQLAADQFVQDVRRVARDLVTAFRTATPTPSNGQVLEFMAVETRATDSASFGVIWGARLRVHLGAVIEALSELVHQHHVEMMRVPLVALEGLLAVASDEARWYPMDVGEIIRAAQDTSTDRRIVNIGKSTHAALLDLHNIAARQRVSPHHADEVSVEVSRGFGEQSWSVSALRVFADLTDLIERGGATVEG